MVYYFGLLGSKKVSFFICRSNMGAILTLDIWVDFGVEMFSF